MNDNKIMFKKSKQTINCTNEYFSYDRWNLQKHLYKSLGWNLYYQH